MKIINLFGYTITICKQGKTESFPSIYLTEQLLSKLPDFNYEWSSETQINWFNALNRLWDMATGQKAKPVELEDEIKDVGEPGRE